MNTLLVREKLAVCLLLVLLGTIAAFSFASKQRALCRTFPTVTVTCVGAVVEPGTIALPAGSQIADLIARVKLTKDADLDKLVLEERVKNNQIFVVPVKGKLSLYVTGAVQKEGVVLLPEGLRFNQLKQHLALTDVADVAIFKRRRRLLCEGETVQIPVKSEIFARK